MQFVLMFAFAGSNLSVEFIFPRARLFHSSHFSSIATLCITPTRNFFLFRSIDFFSFQLVEIFFNFVFIARRATPQFAIKHNNNFCLTHFLKIKENTELPQSANIFYYVCR